MKKALSALLLLTAIIAPLRAAVVSSTDYSNMIDFTISGYNGTETLQNFPVPVRLSADEPLDFDYADVGATKEEAYATLCFTTSEGQSLNYEIEIWNPEGESIIWVSVPEVSGTATKFRAYYGLKEGATHPANSTTAVWSSANYVGVWHMNEVSEDGTSIYDASGNGFTASAKIAAANPTLVTSDNVVLGNSIKCTISGGLFLQDGVLQAYNTEEDRMQDHYSVEGWVHRNSTWINNIIFSTGSGYLTGAQVGLQGYLYGNAHHHGQNNKIPGDQWAFIGATWASENEAAYLFCGASTLNNGNGDFLFQGLNRTDTNTDFSKFSLSSYANGNGTEALGGYMDEVRIRRVASSKDWVQAVYDSSKVGSTFVIMAPVMGLSEVIVGNNGVVSQVSNTTATIEGYFVATDPAACTVTYTLTIGEEIVCSGAPAGALDENGKVVVELSDLLPGTIYDFTFVGEYQGEEAYSIGSFTTVALPQPVISNVSENSATATLSAIISGPAYDAGTASVIFTPAGTGATITETPTFADGQWVASTDALELGMDYFVKFVFTPADSQTIESPYSEMLTTVGVAKQRPGSFSSRMDMTISGYDGADTLENFPVLVRIFSEVAATIEDKNEIRFISSDNTLLAYEIDTWNPAGESTIWVSIPQLSGTETAFTMVWNPIPGSNVHGALAPSRVWQNAGYVGVWHFNSQNADGSFADASGNSATAVPVSSTHPGTIETEGTSANGSSWHHVNAGVKVLPEDTTDWNFAETGYTTEAWMIPKTNFHRMFLYSDSNNAGNANAFGPTELYVMTGDYAKAFWTSDVTSQAVWRLVTTSWKGSSSPEGTSTTFYQNGILIGSWGSKSAVSFIDNGMGLTTGIYGNGSVNYPLDEIRVRRGTSTAAWTQANYDTQAVGTDFITYGELMLSSPATTIIVR